MKTLLKTLAVMLTALVVGQAVAQEQLDLTRDQWVPGGLNENNISKTLLPAFAKNAPNKKGDDVIVFAFNYAIPKLQLAYRSPNGKQYLRTGSLAAGEKLVATIDRRYKSGGEWIVEATVRWAKQCGNWLPYPFKVTLHVPDWTGTPRIDRVDVPRPYAVTVDRDVIVQQIVPTLGGIELNVPPAKPRGLRLVEIGHEEAGRRWEYQKSFWDDLLDFGKVVAFPLAYLIHRDPGINLDNSSSSSSSSSASASASAAAAAAAGGG